MTSDEGAVGRSVSLVFEFHERFAGEAATVVRRHGDTASLTLDSIVARRTEVLDQTRSAVEGLRAQLMAATAEVEKRRLGERLARWKSDAISPLELALADLVGPGDAVMTAATSHDHRDIEVRVVSRNARLIDAALEIR